MTGLHSSRNTKTAEAATTTLAAAEVKATSNEYSQSNETSSATPRRPPRTVKFCHHAKMRLYRHINDMNDDEKRSCFLQPECYDRILEEYRETVYKLDGLNQNIDHQGQHWDPVQQEEEQPLPFSFSSSSLSYYGVESSARMRLKKTARRRAIHAVLCVQDEQDLRSLTTSLVLGEREDDGDQHFDGEDENQKEIADVYRLVGQTNEYQMAAYLRALRVRFGLENNE